MIIAIGGSNSIAQSGDENCEQKDVVDLIKKNKNNNDTSVTEKNHALILVPIIASSPATGFIIGAAIQLAFKGEGVNDRMSLVSGSAQYTTKNQLLFVAKNNIYLYHNKIFLMGDWRLLIFSQTTYGLGTNSPGVKLKEYYDLNGYSTTDDSLAQPMLFNYLKFHQTISWSLTDNIFLGCGMHYDNYNKIKDEKLDTSITPAKYTSNYSYNTYHNFTADNYTLSGLSFNAIYDSRDNLVNPYKGIFANFNYRFNPTFMASDQESSQAYFEFRYFQPLSKKTPRHVLAFWTFANILVEGNMPYMTLPAIGYDQRSRAGRGYTQGRYRGEDLVYGEAEYRFPISPCTKILGGVAFVNVTTASNRTVNIDLFQYVKPAAGAGLRVMIDKQSRTNFQVDFAVGEKSKCFYFGATETF